MFHFDFNEGNRLSSLERDCTTKKQKTSNNSNRKTKKDILHLLILNAIKFFFFVNSRHSSKFDAKIFRDALVKETFS